MNLMRRGRGAAAVAAFGILAACSAAQGDAGPLSGSWQIATVTAAGQSPVDVRHEKARLDVHGADAHADDGINVYDSTYRVGDHQAVAVTSRSASAVGYPARRSREQQSVDRAITVLMHDGSFTVTTSGDAAHVTAGGTTIVLTKR